MLLWQRYNAARGSLYISSFGPRRKLSLRPLVYVYIPSPFFPEPWAVSPDASI